jgi:hypothetical protein
MLLTPVVGDRLCAGRVLAALPPIPGFGAAAFENNILWVPTTIANDFLHRSVNFAWETGSAFVVGLLLLDGVVACNLRHRLAEIKQRDGKEDFGCRLPDALGLQWIDVPLLAILSPRD